MRLVSSNVRTALITLLLVSTPAWAGEGKKIEFTTKSKEAMKYLEEFIHGVETFRPAASQPELAQKITAADPDFAFGQYTLALTTPPAEQPPIFQKAVQLAEHASAGERKYITAMSLVYQQNIPEALKMFQEMYQEYPGDRMVAMLMGQLHQNTGDFQKAQEAFERAAKIDNSTPRVSILLGNCYLMTGDYKKASSTYLIGKKGLPKDTAPFFAFAGPAFVEVYKGNTNAALRYVDDYLKAYDPVTQGFPAVFIWNMKARINLEEGRTAEAMEAYEKGYETVKASQINDQQKQIWEGRLLHGTARTLAKKGEHAKAAAIADQIAEMIKKGGDAGEQFVDSLHYLRGYLKLEKKDFQGAAEELSRISQPDPFQTALLARAYEKLGEKKKAAETYQKVVESVANGIERALVYSEAKKKVAELSD